VRHAPSISTSLQHGGGALHQRLAGIGNPRINIHAFNPLLEAVRGDKVKHKIAHELDVFVAFVAVGPTVNLNVGSEGAGLRIQAALVIGDGLAIVANAADRVIEFGGTRIEAVQLHT
jgi:hypothetical protein